MPDRRPPPLAPADPNRPATSGPPAVARDAASAEERQRLHPAHAAGGVGWVAQSRGYGFLAPADHVEMVVGGQAAP